MSNLQTGVGGVGGSVCDVDSVLGYKRRLIGPWTSLKSDIEDCPRISLDQKTAFKLDLIAFNNWFTGKMPELPFCGDTQLIHEGQDFEARYNNWRRVLMGLSCPPTEPELPPLLDTDPRSPNYKPPENDLIRTLKVVTTAVAVVGGVAALIYGLSIAAPIISATVKTAIPRTGARMRRPNPARNVKRGDLVEFTRDYRIDYTVGDGEFGVAVEDERSDRTVLVELADGSTYRARFIHAYAWGGWMPEELESTYMKYRPVDEDEWLRSTIIRSWV